MRIGTKIALKKISTPDFKIIGPTNYKANAHNQQDLEPPSPLWLKVIHVNGYFHSTNSGFKLPFNEKKLINHLIISTQEKDWNDKNYWISKPENNI